jgi:MSHA biogenesis protein MshN
VSVLNTMLHDLERRGAAAPGSLPAEPRAQPPAPPMPGFAGPPVRRLAHPGLWLAAAATIACAAWLWPRPAHRSVATSEPPPASVAQPQVAVPAPPAPMTEAAAVAPPAAATAAPARIAAAAAPAQARVRPAPPAAPPALEPDAVSASAGVAAPAVAPSAARSELARAMELVERGRNAEAARLLGEALSARPQWSDARSALAALQAEAGERRQALATLLAGVPTDAARFAPTAAQLQAEFNDAGGALRTLEQVPAAARDHGYHALAAAIAQRDGRHAVAVDEYAQALRSAPGDALSWVGMGVSLQALGRDAQALAAYRNAAGATLSADLRRFVQARMAALQASAR